MDEDCQEGNSNTLMIPIHRSPNFKEDEVKLLLNLIKKYKNIIVNRCTNSAANYTKELAWNKIAEIFNSQTCYHERSVDALKTKWENLKREARKVGSGNLSNTDFQNTAVQVATILSEVETNDTVLDEKSILEVFGADDLAELKNIATKLQSGSNLDAKLLESDCDNDSGSNLRSPNFKEDEVKILVNLVKTYRNIIMNKCTNTSANHTKELAWNKITELFNTQTSHCERSVEALRTKWENLKREARRVTSSANNDLQNTPALVASIISEVDSNDRILGEESFLEFVNTDEPSNTKNDSSKLQHGSDLDAKLHDSDCDIDNGNRYRSPSFTDREIKTLVNLVDKYKITILNKSTTMHMCQAKEEAWNSIANLFNNKGFEYKRSVDSLKIKWENLKKEARKMLKNVIDVRPSDISRVTSQIMIMIQEAESGYCEASLQDIDSEESADDKTAEDANDKSELCEDNNDQQSEESDAAEFETRSENFGKKYRSLNFSPHECTLLLQCVKNEKKHILSSDNSPNGISLKSRAWSKITQSFNKKSSKKRSTRVLRTKFYNMRKTNKKVKHAHYFRHKRHERIADTNKNGIKEEPCDFVEELVQAHNTDNEDSYIGGHGDAENGNLPFAADPLITVLSTDSGIDSSSHMDPWNQSENKEVIKLKLQLLNYQLETAKLERKRVEDSLEAEAAERESKAIERALRLRTARLELIAAEMKLGSLNQVLNYPEEEARAQQYMQQMKKK